jgi:NAD+ synthase (glutamine-hydrolysing)
LPNYREYYEARWFRAADGSEPESFEIGDHTVPFGIDLLVSLGPATIGIEICEDLWTPIPPSSQQALAGANVLLNLSASNELIGKAAWRRQLVLSQAGRCLAAYAYASAGPSESTTDLVFSGHCMIAEDGQLLAERRGLPIANAGPAEAHDPTATLVADVDLDRLAHQRQVQNSFILAGTVPAFPYREVRCDPPTRHAEAEWRLRRTVDPQPFVPADQADREARCGEILAMQVAGLTKRLTRLPAATRLAIGISGGLDSTLALLVACAACDAIGWSRERIHGLTMPGFGTSEQTRLRAERLIELLGIRGRTVDIRTLCLETFRGLGHRPCGIDLRALDADGLQHALRGLSGPVEDLVFENVQARVRTLLLMNEGFVLGTGDLSEQALGWSTYNGDHMSMYNVNASIPKTLVRFLVQFYAEHRAPRPLRETLEQIAAAPITPELLPLDDAGQIVQQTEAVIGPYELHDFFLYHFVRCGATREKIRYLAGKADFAGSFTPTQIAATLDQFLRRFFQNQFKRSCVPDGPKVGTVSLSPRGDWRMPSDAEHDAF